jgi:hypothetical protein
MALQLTDTDMTKEVYMFRILTDAMYRISRRLLIKKINAIYDKQHELKSQEQSLIAQVQRIDAAQIAREKRRGRYA